MKEKTLKQIQKINSIEIGDLLLASTELNLIEVVQTALEVLRQPEVKEYLNVLKFSKQLKDSKTFYG